MFDLNRSYFNDLRERAVAAGAAILEEGTALVYVTDGLGGIAVQQSAAGANQHPAGFAICDAMKVTTETVVEQVTVPAAGGNVSLKNLNVIIATGYATGSITAVITNVGAGLGDPGAGNFFINTTGVLSFNVAQALETVTVYYRYTLTADQIVAKYHSRSINNTARDYFSSVSVGCLEGEIFTSMYDTSVAYAIHAPIYLAANGMVSSTAGGGAAIGFVTQLPSVNDGLLGVKFNLPITT